MGRSFVKGCAVGAVCVLVGGAGTVALAGSGVGGVFNLGQTNTVDAQTKLTGSTAGAAQLVVNNTDGVSGSVGVRALNASASAAVKGENSSTGPGVYGSSTSGFGVQAQSAGASSAALQAQNGGGGPAGSFVVNSGVPPFKVNSSTKVASLNADQLDGLDSSALQKRVSGTCAAGTAVNVVNADGSVGCQAVGTGGGWNLTGNAGTTPGTNFLGTTDAHSLVLETNGEQALRLSPTASFEFPSDTPNVVAGSPGNEVLAFFGSTPIGATIAGGGRVEEGGSGFAHEPNVVTDSFGSIGGGVGNQAGDFAGTFSDRAHATVAGGNSNTASGESSTVGGGTGNTASGGSATVPGGSGNTASGDHSFAAGRGAKATMDGSFVWADDPFQFAPVTSPAANSFTVRASGGIWLGTTSSPSIGAGRFIDTSTHAYLSTGGMWVDNSSRTLKHDFRPLNGRGVLARIARLSIRSWSYKAEKPTVRHAGPAAEDFYTAFELGLDNRHISAIDEAGIALAAIQALSRETTTLQRANRTLRTRLTSDEARLTRLEHEITTLTHRKTRASTG